VILALYQEILAALGREPCSSCRKPVPFNFMLRATWILFTSTRSVLLWSISIITYLSPSPTSSSLSLLFFSKRHSLCVSPCFIRHTNLRRFGCFKSASNPKVLCKISSPSSNKQATAPPLIGCPQLFIQHIRSYPTW
jgi:hypothetical protein